MRTLCLLVCLSASLAPLPAWGQSDTDPSLMTDAERFEEARYYAELGSLHYENQRFVEAAEAFQQAWALHPDATLGYNAARSYENGGELDLAVEYYRATLDLEVVDDLLATRCRDAITRIENTIQRLDDERAQDLAQQPAVLTIESLPTGSEVWIDGDLRGATPLDLELASGTYTVQIDSDGFHAHHEDVTLAPAQTTTLRVDLEGVPPETHPNWVAVGVSAGATALFTTLGIVFAVQAHSDHDAAQTNRVLRDQDLFDATVSSGKTAQSLSALFYLSAVAAGVTTVLLGLLTEVEEPGPDPGLDFVWTPHGFGVGWTTSF